ncbi:EF-hand domain-containing protein [Lysobacter niabensis]|uniref:EF-hand domain-containing protein n=1 Tax=Agrilutibacter niabensis TaxID=380628 RepID=UPI0036182AB5
MTTSNRNLLAIALATALLSPAASAGQGGGKGPPDIPQTVSTQGVVSESMPTTNPPERTMGEVRKAEATAHEQATPPPSPIHSQGGEHAAPPAAVVQRDTWTRLDTDGDGRISTTEGAIDSEFNTGFTAMDADRDGFVSDTEYRSAAKASMETGRGGTETSSSSASSLGDVMRRLDTNADGSISISEGDADGSIKSSFATIDANSDGMVTRAEYQAWLKATRK